MSIEAPPTLDPSFTVLDVEAPPHTATPTLRFHLHVDDPLGRADPHDRPLDADQHRPRPARVRPGDTGRLVELFGAPERWASTTQVFRWAHVDVLVKGFTGATSFALDVPCTYDLEVAASKYFYSLSGGEVPLSFLFNGMVLYSGEADRLQVAQVPWSCTARWRMPVDAWKTAMEAYYPGGGWVRLQTDTLDALAARKAERGDHSFDDTRPGAAGMSRLDELVDTLLWEGHQLYPYTPSATKNATPTPFGIVYPPAYAEGSPHTFARLKLQCIAMGEAGFSATVHCLQGGEARRVEISPEQGDAPVRVRPCRAACVAMTIEDFGGLLRVTVAVRNTTEARRGATRTEALESLAAVDPRGRALRTGRALHVADRPARGGRHGGDDLRERQHVPGAGHRGRRRRAGRGDHAARSPADRAGVPREPVRLDRDRGGAAAARARAQRRGAGRAGRAPTPRSRR